MIPQIQYIKLDECAKFSQGKQVPVEEQYAEPFEDSVRFVRIVDFTNENEPPRYIKNYGDSYQVNSNDLIMIRYGSQTAGKVVRGFSGIIANNMFKVDIDRTLFDINFAYYYLSSPKIYKMLMNAQSSSTMPAITFGMLGQIEVPLFNLEIQQKIARVLGAIDDKIELNNSINKNLEQQAQAIFKSWFIDFEPFGGIKPDDWNHGHLSDLAEIKSGKRPNKKSPEKTEEMNIPIVGAASIMGYTNEYLYNEKILVTGRVGTHGIIQKFCTPCWTSDNTLVILTKYYEFIYQILKTVDYQNMNRGSTQPLITQTDLKNIEIIIPNKNILNDYEEKINSLMKLQNNILRENSRLTQLRDTLLPKLMNGEIDVDKVEV